MKINMKEIFKLAHKKTKIMVKKFNVDYRTQFSINVKYIVGMLKLSMVVNEYYEVKKVSFEGIVNFCENRYWEDIEENELCKNCPNRLHCKKMLDIKDGELARDNTSNTMATKFVINNIRKSSYCDSQIKFYIDCNKNEMSRIQRHKYITDIYNNSIRKGYIVGV